LTVRKNFYFFFHLPNKQFSINFSCFSLSRTHTNDSDDEEVATFFPIHKKPKKSRLRKQQKHKELDTFSIQEMTIIESESDGNDGDKSSEEEEDDCDSQLNLELPQRTSEWNVVDKIRQIFCCSHASQNVF
jgi:hypothetical protein